MVIDVESINKHLSLLRGFVADLVELKEGLSLGRLKAERKTQNLILFSLQMAIQSCIDISNHVISELELRRPEEAAEVFPVLAEAGIIPRDFSEKLVQMVKFRNRLVHIYWSIDFDQVYRILQDDLGDFPLFEKYIVDFVEKESKK